MKIQHCKESGEQFEIEEQDLRFYEKISPQFAGKKYPIPAPSLSPQSRLRRRIAWRNEYRYYLRNCDLCAKRIVSVHSADKPYPVYCHSCWWGDSWDRHAAKRAFNPNRPFFDQFIELQHAQPQLAMMNDNGVSSENCEYTQDFAFSKNCYLVTGSWHLHDTMYSSCCNHGKDICDSESVNLNCELVYESCDSQNLYASTFIRSSANCSECHFGIDLRGCTNCFGCIGLRQKEFHFLNQPFEKTEYFEKLESLQLHTYGGQQKAKQLFADFALTIPRKAYHQVNCENCRGDNLFNSKNVHGFDVFNGEGCRFYIKGDSPKFSYDIHNSGNPQWCYECVTPDDSYMTSFSIWCWKCKHVFYSDNCHTSEHLFGCIGLKRSTYCILNMQYSKDDYEKTVATIIEQMQARDEWGEFFPRDRTPFAYNETLAHEYFPLTKEQAVAAGHSWKEKERTEYQPQDNHLPDSIDDVKDSLCQERLACESCTKNYKIIPLELKFYKKMRLPIPRLCSDCRRSERTQYRYPQQLWKRTCDETGETIWSSYAPDRPERVLSLEAYQQQVVK